ncbi:MAG: leucine-rich repeat domain-containing protein [Treponema sp.]|nr:leucine-rich repeat domain-containing protein [Treponema sp.]
MVKQALCLTVLLAIAASAAYARGLFDSEADFLWELSCDGSSVVITGYTGTGTDIWIPPRIQGLPVSGIGNHAFSEEGMGEGFVQASRQFTSVILPNTLTHIEEEAFRGSLLSAITIPASVSYISLMAFCSNRLHCVRIANGATHIGDWAFCCNQIASVDFGDTITHIGTGAFADNLLESVVIGSGVTYIEAGTFAGNRLASVLIPDNVIFIGAGAFANSPLASVTIGGNVAIDRGGFSRYSNFFGTSFAEFYESQGRRAGVYTYFGGEWSVEFR